MRNIFTSFLLLCIVGVHAQDGVLDPFWGNVGNGTTLAPVSGPAGVLSQTSFQKLILLSGGFSLQSFTASNGTNQDFGVARFDADGNLDLSFGGSNTGYILIDFGGDDFSTSMALQSDGKIIIVGNSEVLGDNAFALARLTTAGLLDGTFGTGGKKTQTIGTDNLAFSVAIRPDDKISVGGSVWNGFVYLAAVAQFTSTGTLDAGNFNGGNGYNLTSIPGDVAAYYSLALKTDGSIVAAGSAIEGDHDFLLAQYTSLGLLDMAGFGSGAGYVLTDYAGRSEQAYAVAISGGNIFLAGYTDNGTGTTVNNDFALAKYSSVGVLDAGFGKVSTDFGANEMSFALAVQSDGKIILAGTRFSGNYPGGDNDFAVVRYTTSGTPDLLFGGNNTGKNTVDFGGNDPGLSMALGNGYIQLGGVNGAGAGALNNLAQARLINTSTPLPITLFTFTGTRQSNTIVLGWKTLEQDVLTYEIERSGDGRNFNRIGSVAAMGNSSNARSYTFIDPLPLPGVNVYRLKVVAANSALAYSFLVIVRFGSKAVVQACPNPVGSLLHLQVNAPAGNLEIQITDVSGRVVRKVKLTSTGNPVATSVDMTNLQRGIYFVRYGRDTVKVIKE